MNSRKIRCLVEAALCIGLAVALSRLKLFRMPQGGSVTLEMVPLFIFAARWGVRQGMIAGAVAGTLQFLLGGYMVHPAQLLLDYPVAYAMTGLAGLWNDRVAEKAKNCIPGIILGCLGRFLCHVASGVIFFAQYAPEGTSPIVYSVVYNSGYMSANTLLALIIVPLILPRLAKIR